MWALALKSDKPVEMYNESKSEMDQPEVDIDSLPNVDWLRQT